VAEKVLITGASGLIGTRLTEFLLKRGTPVVHLGRRSRGGKVPCFQWSINENKMDAAALDGVTAIIHLAGAGVAERRWSDKRKKEIHDSRVNSTRLLADELKKGKHRVTDFISASAIGYYGFKQNGLLTETNPPGNDFLARVTTQWELESQQIAQSGIRTAQVRIGIVLSAKGGALKQMATPIRFGVGAALGNGKQWMSWIHIDDLCSLFVFLLDNKNLYGPFNAVSETPVTNSDLTKAIAAVLNKPLWLPYIPSFALWLMFGEMAEIILEGSRVSPAKILSHGFLPVFNSLDKALNDLLAPGLRK
jgi:uncharacterized protein